MSTISALRIKDMFGNLFSPDSQYDIPPTPDAPQMQDPNSDPNDEIAQIQKLFPTSHDASDRLKSTLDSQPQRSNFEPSRMQRIFAALGGMGVAKPSGSFNGQPTGFESDPEKQERATSRILDKPYEDAKSDWELKMKPLAELATAEKGENTNSRIATNNVMQSRDRDKAITQRYDASEKRANTAAAALKEKEDYMTFLKEKEMRKGTMMRSDSTGHVYSWNPNNNYIEYLYNPETGEKITDTKLPEEERLRIQHNNKMAENSAKEKNDEKLEGTKQEGRLALQGEKTAGAEAVKATPPGVNPASQGPKLVVGKSTKKFPNGKTGVWMGNGVWKIPDTGSK